MKQPAWVLCVAMWSGGACALAADSPVALGGSATPVSMPASAIATRPGRSIEVGDALDLDVYPKFMLEQSTASVRLRIEPDTRSRGVWVEWNSAEGGSGAHLIPLDGDAAPIRFDVPLKRLDAGEYAVSATLMRSDGTRVVRAATLTVFGR